VKGERGDRSGDYTEACLPRIPFWGVRGTIGLSNPLNGWVRRKCFYLRSCFGVLGGTYSVQILVRPIQTFVEIVL
jgi:hypothetical protein